jgi:hypothetical protein
VWPEYDGVVNDYNIETLVSRLRQKLVQGGVGADAIVTVKKRGYRLSRDAGWQSGIPADPAGATGGVAGPAGAGPVGAAGAPGDGPGEAVDRSGRPETPTRA